MGFVDRTGSHISRRYRAELTLALKRLAAGNPLSREWLSGFYFNDGLFRLAALYERTLRLATNSSDQTKFSRLRKRAVARGLMNSNEEFSALDTVRNDVNDFKHIRDGLLVNGRKVKLAVVVQAAEEAHVLLTRAILKPADTESYGKGIEPFAEPYFER